ncbi:hypothetical protein [Nocardia brasiliensis]|uniref:hypothetical protein n=1 Tax=Nocardia brasiliensis TaxID=37326 RepID=UPI0024548A7C|nr:hypothetical protein [Nocardia brasiliensis]
MPQLNLSEQDRRAIILKMYRTADELGWEFRTNPEKTEQYRKWFKDPQIGQRIINAYGVSEQDVRVWMKDVPMKEYARAQEGIGSFAQYVPQRFRGPDEIVQAACGGGWSVVEGSIDGKPNHCLATNGAVERYVCWGSSKQLRDLVWASVEWLADNPSQSGEKLDDVKKPGIVVTTRDGQVIDTGTRKRNEQLAGLCGFVVVHLHRSMIDNPDLVTC